MFRPQHHQHDAAPSPHPRSLPLPLVLLITCILAYTATPAKHSLLTSAIAWVCIAGYTSLKKTGARRLYALPQRLSWCAGVLLAVGQICRRAVDGRGIWWANALLPLSTYLILRNEIIIPSDATDTTASSPLSPGSKSRSQHNLAHTPNKAALAVLTCSGLVALSTGVASHSTVALGLSYTLLTALAFLLTEKARIEAHSGRANNAGGSVIYSANGLLSQPPRPPGDVCVGVVREVSVAAAVATGIAAFALEKFSFGGIVYWGFVGRAMGQRWLLGQAALSAVVGVAVVGVHCGMRWTLLMMIQQHGTFNTSLVPLFAAILSQLLCDFSLSRVLFAALCAASTWAFLEDQSTHPGGGGGGGGSGKRMRFGRILTLIAVISFSVLTIVHLREPVKRVRWNLKPEASYEDVLQLAPPAEPLAPKTFANTHEHPITQLVRDAESSWQAVLRGQSQSLEDAVTEYKRRYGIPPPPNFDKWYEFAKRKGVQLIDEFDTVHKVMLPFWGVAPATIRARAREAIGYADNMLMGLAIRDGKPSAVTGGEDWLQQAAVGMMQDFVQWLPDMDLAFNTHDEPRVVVPHDDLSRLVNIALNENQPAALRNPHPRNAFSPRPADTNNGRRFAECKTTRFNWYAHQPVWDPSRLSCAPDTPARALDEHLAADNLTAYALGELGFIYNTTAFSDICNSPSLSQTFGFFDRPNAFNTVHDLFPIFSQSKISSFQDILYPSPWYWYGKVAYQEWKDMEYSEKTPQLLWRGSTTGGFSRAGGWRRQHRQGFVRKVNALDEALILEDVNAAYSASPEYKPKHIPRQSLSSLLNVHFSHIGQCDPGDCAAQKEFFPLASGIDQQDHWAWRFLLDMDGNAFSGRFYAFLKSKSLVFKMAVFREWHQEWLRAWVHYVPLSLRGEEVLEGVRFFAAEGEGEGGGGEGGGSLGERIAGTGSEWAGKALRNEDFEVWFFRLLLEYGRVIDDARAEIGFDFD